MSEVFSILTLLRDLNSIRPLDWETVQENSNDHVINVRIPIATEERDFIDNMKTLLAPVSPATDEPPPPGLGTTSDGVPIREGLAVFTNEARVGEIRLERYRATDHGWFDVEYPREPDGQRLWVLQNAERVATHLRGRDAAQELSRIHTRNNTADTNRGSPTTTTKPPSSL